ncbi:MATE family efflux transporter [Vibrio sp. WXL210]|uniref:MATE family efflux transporter n=1 Tax=Vibrio sp. WXL210 TaxID=3450709 RepID=UPI003EC8F4F2
MTVPMTFGMVAVLLFNLVDTFFISLLGTESLAAISYTFPVTFAINCITMGLGVGLSSQLGRLLGQGQARQAASFSTHAVLLATTLVTLASTLGYFAIEPLFLALGATPSLVPLIHDYMVVWYLAVPLLAIPMTGNSAIRASGDTKTPAMIMMLAGLINGLLDPLLIFGLGPVPALGIQGAAIASAISWSVAACASLYVLAKREHLLALPDLNQLFADWRATLTIGLPAALSSAMMPLAGAVIMRLLSQYGHPAVAAYGAAQRVESLLILVLMALTSALTPFMAQNFGAEKPQRSFEGLFASMRFSIVFQLLIFIVMVPLSMPIAALFSQEAAVDDLLWRYLLLVPLSYGFQGIMMMLSSALNAMHKPLTAFYCNALRLFVFTLPCAWLGGYWYGAEGVFIGIAAGNVLGGCLGYLYALRLRSQYTLANQ